MTVKHLKTERTCYMDLCVIYDIKEGQPTSIPCEDPDGEPCSIPLLTDPRLAVSSGWMITSVSYSLHDQRIAKYGGKRFPDYIWPSTKREMSVYIKWVHLAVEHSMVI